MARIRTIKPEFWTDSKIVQLPFEARLLFIGMWNFCDDDGYIANDPDQLQMQILPGDDVDAAELVDLLIAAELVDSVFTDDKDWLHIKSFLEHQRISHPTKSEVAPELSGKKQSVPAAERRLLAKKYGCEPGGRASCTCFYCGEPGSIWWPVTSKGKPGYWVGFSLEIDHFTPEANGGETLSENFVLACRTCNRSKATGCGISRILRSIPEDSGALQPERKGKERKGISLPTLSSENGHAEEPPEEGERDFSEEWENLETAMHGEGIMAPAKVVAHCRSVGLTPPQVRAIGRWHREKHPEARGGAKREFLVGLTARSAATILKKLEQPP